MADTIAESPNLFTRHPRCTIAAMLLLGTAVILLGAEWALRSFGTLNINYYTGFHSPGIHKYPYGNIPINKDGYPDEEFVVNDDVRKIGYVGDSITYGVGAGYGYRMPDILRKAYPQFHHFVFANVGEDLEQNMLVEQVQKFRLNAVVYIMNLNDILPDPGAESEAAESKSWINTLRQTWLGRIDAALRGRSYLYTYSRLGLKNALQRLGYEAHGLEAFELFPQKNRALVESTARRAVAVLDYVHERWNVDTCIVIIPYEMQISADAARRYRELGFRWENGFEAGSTQDLLMAEYDRLHAHAFDARQAFNGLNLNVGDAFVYNRGDKTDWNHPNRVGHRIIASWLTTNRAFVSECIMPQG
jgi:hypothetical protein